MESLDSCFSGDCRAWKVDGRAQALVDLGLAMSLDLFIYYLNRTHLVSKMEFSKSDRS